MNDWRKNIVNKDLLIGRIIRTIPDESRLVKRIIRQVKNARKKPKTRLNIDENSCKFTYPN